MPSVYSETRYGRPLLSPDEELRFHDALVRQNQLTLLVSMRTNNLEQTGPTRILTYSQDPSNRNFTLGQIHKTLTFRLRTPTSGFNGTDPALYSGPVLSLNRTAFVAAVYDGRISRLYVDGKLVAHADLGARRPRLPTRVLFWLPREMPIREIELGAAESLLSGLFTLGSSLWLEFLAGRRCGGSLVRWQAWRSGEPYGSLEYPSRAWECASCWSPWPRDW